MKHISLGKVYEVVLLAVLLVIAVHAPLVIWLGSLLPDQAEVLKAWKEILLTMLSVLAVILVTRGRRWPDVLRSIAIKLSLAYIAIHLLMVLIIGGDALSVVAGLMIDLRFVVMFILMYVLIVVRPKALPRVLKTVVAGAGIVLSFGLLQITALPDNFLAGIGYSKQTIAPFITIDQNPDFVRINSTLRGPNPLGALAVVYVALALAYLLNKYAKAGVIRRLAAVAASFAGVAVLFATYSRSAYGALVAAVVTLLALSHQINKRLLLLGGILFAWAGGLLLLTAQSDWFSNVILHEDPESTVVTKSNDEHFRSLEVGLQRMASEPLGHGVGSTGSASLYDNDATNDIVIENYYFFVAHEAGWLGLALFVGLFGYILIQLYYRRSEWWALGLCASGIGLALIGVLLPIWADDTVAVLWWGLAGAAIAVPIRQKANRKF
jgi:hypothetical protein